jgi:hypothetical protein
MKDFTPLLFRPLRLPIPLLQRPIRRILNFKGFHLDRGDALRRPIDGALRDELQGGQPKSVLGRPVICGQRLLNSCVYGQGTTGFPNFK